MTHPALDRHVAAVRRFNRFYTRQIGLLHEGYLRSPFSLTEVRVLYELAQRENLSAAELGRELGLDPGYLSRLLRGFRQRGLLARTASAVDGRRHHLVLTSKGRRAIDPLQARSQHEIGAMLATLSAEDQRRLTRAMALVETLLGGSTGSPTPYLLRPPHAGDFGWIVHRHAVLYAREHGWDEQFEALVAGIVARFIQHHDPRRERCWMAEQDEEVVGSVLLARRSTTVAQLRLLLVEPRARGLGIGARLVAECVGFARHAGYRKVTLWTNSVLVAARRLYEAAGFRLVHQEPHRSFGHDLVGETWDLTL